LIVLKNVTKIYRVGNLRKVIAKNLNLQFESKAAVGLFGKNGAGKSTLLRMISGIELPTSGRIEYSGTTSWPVGFKGSFHPDLSGAQNIRFIARIYGVDTDSLLTFVKRFSELDAHFDAPFRTYSAGMRSRLAFSASMGIQFDTYLIDEVTSVGDAAFRERSNTMLSERIGASGAIIVSHSMSQMKKMCDSGVVLANGNAKKYNDVEEAIFVHEEILNGKIPTWAMPSV
jgi:capsular polysaccharide transport system ATP-binding protein